MRERNIILILCFILLAIGIGASYLFLYSADFNFYKSEFTINGNQVAEKLYFTPDEDYHTLYRNFVDSMYVNSQEGNSVTIKNVRCSDGVAYAYAGDGFYTFSNGIMQEEQETREYTEMNEYGCNFGSDYGFFAGKEYWIEASYELNAENLFAVNGKNYIKFVAYSPDNHVFLNQDNLIITGEAEMNSKYAPKDNVVIYIPYDGETAGKTIYSIDNLEYDSSSWFYVLSFILGIIPALSLYLVWNFLGKENIEPDLPEELSDYPMKRKGWEVAAFFNPPFNQIDTRFLSSLMLSLYWKKIIDVKAEKGFWKEKCYIKIINPNAQLDDIEKNFIETLKILAEKSKFKDGYVDISSAAKSLSAKLAVRKKHMELQKIIQKKGEHYLSSLGAGVYVLINFFLIFIASLLAMFGALIASIAGTIIGLVLTFASGVLAKFKGRYYEEYLQWQGFKEHLKHAESLKIHKSQGVIIWGDYLIYAAAFGIAEKVIKELEARGLITKQQAAAYVATTHASTSFASATGYSSSGHSGAGGGGVGGGGGGGR